MPDVLMVIPTYNEIDSLPGVLDDIRAHLPGAHVLVVDDASPDGTGMLAQHYDPDHVFVLHRTAKDGLAQAYKEGFAWGLERGYDIIGQMDADGSHPAAALVAMLHSPADVIIGSRWVPGGKTQGWSRRREVLSRAGNRYIEAVLGLRVRDATSGMRLYRTRFLRRLDLSTLDASGFVFQTEMTVQDRRLGATIAEVPITFTERAAGVSKMSLPIVLESLALVTKNAVKNAA